MSKRVAHILALLSLCLVSTNALVEILSPPEIAGVYPDAPINMNPRKFNITGELFYPGPDICQKDIKDMNVTRKIMLVMGDQVCGSVDFARAILKNNPGVLGQIILCEKRTCSVLGHVEAREFDNDQSIQFPSLECNDYQKIWAYMQKSDRQPVIIHMQDTDYNPWLALGDGPAGQFTQVFFELFAFVCLVIALAKLFVFVKFQGFRANVSQICLEIESVAAIMRILYFVQPLNFGIIYMPLSATTWFIEGPNILSLLTTLLITFYWQEIISVMKERLSNKLITNLTKFRVPFLLVAIVVVTIYIVATINSILFFMSSNANTISAIVALVVNFGVSVFFFIIGFKILRVSSANSKSLGERKTNRVSKFIVAAAVFMDLRILGLVLYISPATTNGRGPYFAIWWILWLANFGISFSKIMAFEPPPDAGSSFRRYFRYPNIFVRMVLEKYLGWSATESLSSNVPMSNAESSSKMKTSDVEKQTEKNVEESIIDEN